MKCHLIIHLLLLSMTMAWTTSADDVQTDAWQASAEQIERWAKRRAPGINYKEELVPDCVLPDPLVMASGEKVAA